MLAAALDEIQVAEGHGIEGARINGDAHRVSSSAARARLCPASASSSAALLPRGARRLPSSEHTGQLIHPRVARQRDDLGVRASRGDALRHMVVAVGVGRDLRKMGHAQNLVPRGEPRQPGAHRHRHAAGNARVDLVEHQDAARRRRLKTT